MNNEIIEPLQELPKLPTKACKIYALILSYFLRFSSVIVALYVWYAYHLFYALGALIMSYLVLGIIKAKMRDLAIPLKQHERNYSDKELSIWYMAQEVCWRIR